MATCQHCGREFLAERSTAKYHDAACRIAAHRAAKPTAKAPTKASGGVSEGSDSPKATLSPPSPNVVFCNAKEPILRASKPAAAPARPSRPVVLPKGIVRDEVYPNMYRIRLPDGGLS